jgi:transcriptional regulator with XRE-family HTH domain
MSSTLHQAREALGQRLREIRKDARLTGRGLAELTGWPGSKISKIEYGKQPPSEDDLRIWCQVCETPDQLPDLLATVRDIEAMYVEWRRMLRAGIKRRQEKSIRIEGETRAFRWYEPVIIPGLLQTAEYAAAIMMHVANFYEIPDDVGISVATRMERQQILYRGDHRFHFVIAQQALKTTVGDHAIMTAQLDRLMTVQSMPRVSLGILPEHAAYKVPTNQFIIFDDRLVNVETISAELAITQPREVFLYVRSFNQLARQSVYGKDARALIGTALESFANAPEIDQ